MKKYWYCLILTCIRVLSFSQAPSSNDPNTYLEKPYPFLVPYPDEASALSKHQSTFLLDIDNDWIRQKKAIERKKESAGLKAREAIVFSVIVQLPSDWIGKQTFLFFPDVKTSFELFVNHRQVAGIESALPSRVNITSFVNGRSDTIAIQVSADKDYQSIAEIVSSAYVFAAAPIHVNDLNIYSTYSGTHPRSYVWTAYLNHKIKNYAVENWYLDHYYYRVKLLEINGTLVKDINAAHENLAKPRQIETGEEAGVGSFFHSIQCKRWNAETPNLYWMVLQTGDSLHQTLEVYARKTGIRITSYKNYHFYVNNTSVTLKPVAYVSPNHEVSKVDFTYFIRLVQDLKRNNVNTLLLSGHPVDSRLLETCDNLGIYIIYRIDADPNLGSKNHSLGMDFTQKHYAQVITTIHQLKNHPSLIAWQLETKALNQPYATRLIDTIRSIDSYRPLLAKEIEKPWADMTSIPAWHTLTDQDKSDLKKKYQSVAIEIHNAEDNVIQLTNQYDFIALKGVVLQWEIRDNDNIIQHGEIADLDMDTKKSKSIQLPFTFSDYKENNYTFRFKVKLSKKLEWGYPEGEVAYDNFKYTVVKDDYLLMKQQTTDSMRPAK